MKWSYPEQLLWTPVQHGSWWHRARLLSASMGLGTELSLYTLWTSTLPLRCIPSHTQTPIQNSDTSWCGTEAQTEGHRGAQSGYRKHIPMALVVLLITATGISQRWLKCIPLCRQKRKMHQTQNSTGTAPPAHLLLLREQLFSASHL